MLHTMWIFKLYFFVFLFIHSNKKYFHLFLNFMLKCFDCIHFLKALILNWRLIYLVMSVLKAMSLRKTRIITPIKPQTRTNHDEGLLKANFWRKNYWELLRVHSNRHLNFKKAQTSKNTSWHNCATESLL